MSQNILSKVEAPYFVWLLLLSDPQKVIGIKEIVSFKAYNFMNFVKNSRGGREVNMINTLSKINLWNRVGGREVHLNLDNVNNYTVFSFWTLPLSCFKSVSRMFQVCFKYVSWMFKGCFKSGCPKKTCFIYMVEELATSFTFLKAHWINQSPYKN